MESQVRVLVLVAAGTNCDRETIRAFRAAGAEPERVQIRKLTEETDLLSDYHIIVIPGGFSYGDHVGAGRIFASEIEHLMWEEFNRFIEKGKLILGICNGFQVLAKAGLLPGNNSREQKITLAENDSGKFEDRWVHLKVNSQTSEFITNEEEQVFLPVAHAEGKFVSATRRSHSSDNRPESGNVLQELKENDQIIFRYTTPDDREPEYPWNPNGSTDHIAGISDPTGRILGMMPHPERFYSSFQHPKWTRWKNKQQPDGLKIIQNGVNTIQNRFFSGGH